MNQGGKKAHGLMHVLPPPDQWEAKCRRKRDINLSWGCFGECSYANGGCGGKALNWSFLMISEGLPGFNTHISFCSDQFGFKRNEKLQMDLSQAHPF